MSDDMERKKNERLTAKQIEEEEEMKRELKGNWMFTVKHARS